MTQAEIGKLSGVELARKVAEAVGWKVLREGHLSSRPYVVLETNVRFRPQSSADDALEALEVMNARGWTVRRSRQFQWGWAIQLENVDGVIGLAEEADGESFPEALSRAICAAHEAEVKDGK